MLSVLLPPPLTGGMPGCRVLLCKFGSTDDVLIATSYSIRPPGTENLIGYFLRMLPLRNRLLEGDTFAELIKREMATLNGAMQHGVLPLQDIVRLCSLPRVPGANSTFQAGITYDEEGELSPVATAVCACFAATLLPAWLQLLSLRLWCSLW